MKLKNILIAIGWMIVGSFLTKAMAAFRDQGNLSEWFMQLCAGADSPPVIAKLTGVLLFMFFPALIGFPISIYLNKKQDSVHGKWMFVSLLILTISTALLLTM